MPPESRAGLLEREGQDGAVADALAGAVAGRGTIVLLEGVAGIGKTTLVGSAVARAKALGVRALVARGGEFERSFAYGVVRQLFEPVLGAASDAERATLLAGAAAHAAPVVDPLFHEDARPLADASVVHHGLYWLTAGLAASGPLLVAVDDLHWADDPSLAWIVHVARRVGELPVVMVLATRPPEPGAPSDAVAALSSLGEVRRVEVEPLSLAAAQSLVRAFIGEGADPGFVAACHEATGGNPFYLTELLSELRSTGASGSPGEIAAIERLRPRAIGDAVAGRLARLGEDAAAVAEAVALLEPTAHLRHVAALAGTSVEAAAAAADKLVAGRLLAGVDPCRFLHPILRAAVEDRMAPARRALLYGKAAELLAGEGAPASAIAACLLRATPAAVPERVATLRSAARQAFADGAYGSAARYLERALAEPPPPHQRAGTLLELGSAAALDQRSDAADYLRAALDAATRPQERADAAVGLGQLLLQQGELQAAYELTRAVARELTGRTDQATLNLEAFVLNIALPVGKGIETAKRIASMASELEPDSLGASLVIADSAFIKMMTMAPVHEVLAEAERSLIDGEMPISATDFVGREAPILAMLWMDELERADELITRAIERARELGSEPCAAHCSAVRAFVFARKGLLARAEADLEQALAPGLTGPAFSRLVALLAQTPVLVARGRPEEAARIDEGLAVPPSFEAMPLVALVRAAQGQALLAANRFAEAVPILRGAGRTLLDAGALAPNIQPWRSDLALALAGCGEHAEATSLAAQEFELAERSGVGRARGIALRACGLLTGGADGLALLERSAEALATSPSRLEYASSRVELGAALRRDNQRILAKQPLTSALGIAQACGAHAIADRALAELRATGARPRRIQLSGRESLTASELRVAELATHDLTNREIAQALFVTLGTVETHLTHAYRKLDITSREELGPALGSMSAAV